MGIFTAHQADRRRMPAQCTAPVEMQRGPLSPGCSPTTTRPPLGAVPSRSSAKQKKEVDADPMQGRAWLPCRHSARCLKPTSSVCPRAPHPPTHTTAPYPTTSHHTAPYPHPTPPHPTPQPPTPTFLWSATFSSSEAARSRASKMASAAPTVSRVRRPAGAAAPSSPGASSPRPGCSRCRTGQGVQECVCGGGGEGEGSVHRAAPQPAPFPRGAGRTMRALLSPCVVSSKCGVGPRTPPPPQLPPPRPHSPSDPQTPPTPSRPSPHLQVRLEQALQPPLLLLLQEERLLGPLPAPQAAVVPPRHHKVAQRADRQAPNLGGVALQAQQQLALVPVPVLNAAVLACGPGFRVYDLGMLRALPVGGQREGGRSTRGGAVGTWGARWRGPGSTRGGVVGTWGARGDLGWGGAVRGRGA